jgi:hypothetical protein
MRTARTASPHRNTNQQQGAKRRKKRKKGEREKQIRARTYVDGPIGDSLSVDPSVSDVGLADSTLGDVGTGDGTIGDLGTWVVWVVTADTFNRKLDDPMEGTQREQIANREQAGHTRKQRGKGLTSDGPIAQVVCTQHLLVQGLVGVHTSVGDLVGGNGTVGDVFLGDTADSDLASYFWGIRSH